MLHCDVVAFVFGCVDDFVIVVPGDLRFGLANQSALEDDFGALFGLSDDRPFRKGGFDGLRSGCALLKCFKRTHVERK